MRFRWSRLKPATGASAPAHSNGAVLPHRRSHRLARNAIVDREIYLRRAGRGHGSGRSLRRSWLQPKLRVHAHARGSDGDGSRSHCPPIRAARCESKRPARLARRPRRGSKDRKSTRLNSSHVEISYAVFCLKKKKEKQVVVSLYIKKRQKTG